MAKIRAYGMRLILLLLGFIGSLAIIGVFSARAIGYAPHPTVDDPIRPWMSLPYIAHSYKVPAYVLYDAIGLAHTPHDRRPIMRIAREIDMPVAVLIGKLQEAIIHSRPPYPTPQPATPILPAASETPTPRSP